MRFIIRILLVILVVIIFVTVLVKNRTDLLRHQVAEDHLVASVFCNVFLELYQFSGYDCGDAIDNFSKSGYYPFRSAPTTMYHERLKITTIRRGNGIRRNIVFLGKDKLRTSLLFAYDETIVQQTHRRMASYLVGVTSRKVMVQKIRNELINKLPNGGNLVENDIPLITLKGDLPINDTELTQYIDWLKHVEGDTQLLDGWGHPYEFSISNNMVGCRSAGKDGKFRTNDDIVETRRIK